MEFINKYKSYILIGIIILLIIIIGFIYGNKTTTKYEEPKVIEEEKKEIDLLKVDIKGEIENPGVYEFSSDDRVIDVINKAGGLTKDANTDYLNLSKKITDEMVIIIYSNDEVNDYKESLENGKVKEIIKYEVIEKEIPCPNITNNACVNKKETSKEVEETNDQKDEIKEEKEEKSNLININTASKEELMTLPSIGESKANLIIDYRNTESFKEIEDIKNVKGIGDSLFEKIKDYITT